MTRTNEAPDAHAIVFEGKVSILDNYAGKEKILARITDSFLNAVEKLESRAARDAVARDGLRSLHVHFPASKVARLEAMVRTDLRDDLYYWGYEVGNKTLGLADPFYIDMLIVMRIHYPHVVARESEAAEKAPYDWQERARLGLAAIRDPRILLNQVTRRIRKRGKIASNRIAYDPKSYHGELPVLAHAHGAHIDTWYGHSFDGFNVWLSIDGVDLDNTVILYPELFGKKVSYDPKSMYLAEGQALPKPSKVDLKPGELLLFNPEMLHGTQVNISDQTRVALTIRINPYTPRFNDDAPFNAEHWYASNDVAKRRFTRVSVFPSDKFQGDPSISQEPLGPNDVPRMVAAEADGGAVLLCTLDDLAKQGRVAVNIGTRKLLVVKDQEGVRAFNRRCPHRGIDLVDGYADAEEIFCPGHGISFGLHDGTSKCAAFRLRQFKVEIEDGKVFLPAKASVGIPETENAHG